MLGDYKPIGLMMNVGDLPGGLKNLKNPCWLMIGDYTTQYIGDYNHPIGGIPSEARMKNGMIEGCNEHFYTR